MLSDRERTDARRFLGYPAVGADRAGTAGLWYVPESGAVEYRLNNLAPSEEAVLRGYLDTLGGLERAIPETGTGLDTASAAGWVRNPAEVQEREQLFDRWRRRLCAFLGVPPGPALAGRSSVVLVV